MTPGPWEEAYGATSGAKEGGYESSTVEIRFSGHNIKQGVTVGL